MKILEGSEEGYEDYKELTAHLLVIYSVDKQEFKIKSLNTYTYQVVGGVQRFTAITMQTNGEWQKENFQVLLHNL